jgi:DNA-binding transcriptional ArsR family regulator
MANAERVLDVCADPTRRAVLVSLRAGPRAVGEIANGLPVTRSAVSQHLKVLAEAGLVRSTADGTRRLYRIDLDGFAELRSWFDQFWDDVLDAFSRHAEEDRQ